MRSGPASRCSRFGRWTGYQSATGADREGRRPEYAAAEGLPQEAAPTNPVAAQALLIARAASRRASPGSVDLARRIR